MTVGTLAADTVTSRAVDRSEVEAVEIVEDAVLATDIVGALICAATLTEPSVRVMIIMSAVMSSPSHLASSVLNDCGHRLSAVEARAAEHSNG